jgi:hypothetical protein
VHGGTWPTLSPLYEPGLATHSLLLGTLRGALASVLLAVTTPRPPGSVPGCTIRPSFSPGELVSSPASPTDLVAVQSILQHRLFPGVVFLIN